MYVCTCVIPVDCLVADCLVQCMACFLSMLERNWFYKTVSSSYCWIHVHAHTYACLLQDSRWTIHPGSDRSLSHTLCSVSLFVPYIHGIDLANYYLFAVICILMVVVYVPDDSFPLCRVDHRVNGISYVQSCVCLFLT